MPRVRVTPCQRCRLASGLVEPAQIPPLPSSLQHRFVRRWKTWLLTWFRSAAALRREARSVLSSLDFRAKFSLTNWVHPMHRACPESGFLGGVRYVFGEVMLRMCRVFFG
jgi:hypothetical protein